MKTVKPEDMDASRTYAEFEGDRPGGCLVSGGCCGEKTFVPYGENDKPTHCACGKELCYDPKCSW